MKKILVIFMVMGSIGFSLNAADTLKKFKVVVDNALYQDALTQCQDLNKKLTQFSINVTIPKILAQLPLPQKPFLFIFERNDCVIHAPSNLSITAIIGGMFAAEKITELELETGSTEDAIREAFRKARLKAFREVTDQVHNRSVADFKFDTELLPQSKSYAGCVKCSAKD